MNALVVTVRASGWADLPAGLATALVAELEERFRSVGAPRINLLLLPDDPAGLASWQRLGHLPCPDVLCSEPLDGVTPTASG